MSISYSPTPTALRVDIEPSNYFRVALFSVVSVVLGAIFYAALAWPLRLLLTILALIYGGYCWRAQMRQRGVLQWRSVWFWRGADGTERVLRLYHSTLWPGLIVLTFSDIESRDIARREKFSLILFADSLDSDCARRLRVYLNHFPVFATAEAGE